MAEDKTVNACASKESGALEATSSVQSPQASESPSCEQQRAGFVALVGMPNAGKSTLLNAFLNMPLAITSPKAQTTRFPMRGVGVQGNTQIILVDTPGLLQKVKTPLDKAMLKAAINHLQDADVTLLVIDVTCADPWAQLHKIWGAQAPKNLWVVFNKIDKIAKTRLLVWAKRYQERTQHIFMVSALHEKGTQDVWQALAQAMPVSPWLFDADVCLTMPYQLWSAEIVREVCLKELNEEIPHKLYVEPERFEEQSARSVVINQVVHVESKGHKKIILGKQGERIKTIGQKARLLLEKRLRRKVHLYLYVRVSENWMHKPDFYRMVGMV